MPFMPFSVNEACRLTPAHLVRGIIAVDRRATGGKKHAGESAESCCGEEEENYPFEPRRASRRPTSGIVPVAR